MQTFLRYIKPNKSIVEEKGQLKDIEKEIIISATDGTLTVFREGAEEIYNRLIQRYGEFIDDYVNLELEGNEEVIDALDNAMKEMGYVRWEKLRRVLE
ncbi:MAG: hypothetical protein QIT36_gp058 [Methanophagales virus GBV301]|uniref:Uncharacterized protein n=1 Tax=Methanophagales virus GBV301 TaxID=2999280 RepID=A0A9E8V7W5_9CAUD|nr:MAG: hypothetical protein QIT36_gp058 [Methanophagales virus GBV301]WAE39482.1 MAG: hypothetical protein LDLAKGPJ_00058 [Methanophagales virus GBV301]